MENIVKLDLPESEPGKGWKPDQDEIAQDIAAEWQGKVAFFHRDWHIYEGGVWRVREEQQLGQAIRIFLRRYRANGIRIDYKLVRALARMVEGDFLITDGELIGLAGRSKQYINLRNGLYNLDTHQLEPHQAQLYFTTQLDFAYDPEADCPHFRKYLNTSLVKEDLKTTDYRMVDLVMEALAYSMTARTDMKASFWLIGKPDSGKSTILRLIRSLMGNLHTTIDLNRIGNNFMLGGIIGKRVVTTTEADASAVLPDALYKALTGGKDEIWADVKNKPAITFVPEAKLWWAMNDAPRVTDRSGATHNRLYPILFNRTFAKEEQNRQLDALLEQERPGIFNRLMEAYRRLARAGKFTIPEQSQHWLEEYRMETDVEWLFVSEMCEIAAGHRIQGKELYDAYNSWCLRNGFQPKNSTKVAREWERLGFKKTRIEGISTWHGLRLLSRF